MVVSTASKALISKQLPDYSANVHVTLEGARGGCRMAVAVLAAGLLGSFWWIVRGGRRARRLYRRWRWRNSIEVYGFGAPGRAWPIDAFTAAVLALAAPLVPHEIDAATAWRRVCAVSLIVWWVAGAPPFDRAWH